MNMKGKINLLLTFDPKKAKCDCPTIIFTTLLSNQTKLSQFKYIVWASDDFKSILLFGDPKYFQNN